MGHGVGICGITKLVVVEDINNIEIPSTSAHTPANKLPLSAVNNPKNDSNIKFTRLLF